MLELLGKFERIAGAQLEINDKYLVVLQRFARDLDLVRKTYQKQRENPPTPRNIPPVSLILNTFSLTQLMILYGTPIST